MILKNRLKIGFKKAVFGWFFVIIGILGLTSGVVGEALPVFADENTTTTVVDDETQNKDEEQRTEEKTQTEAAENGASCKDSLGVIGWLVCPSVGVISKAVDGLYGLIQSFLVINPISAEDGTPIYEIWKYLRGLTNIIFIIFLLVVIYSQITGIGFSNYNIKKTLPKLIVAAVLVNASFLICSLAVDLSNVVGSSLRGVFTTIQEATIGAGGLSGVDFSSVFTAIAAGSGALVLGGVIAFATGTIWMLIPTILGAIVAVVIGLITIALRQAVVVLLVMISPLAMVAYMLPNTEKWFAKWKDLLFKMLIFYPMFSLLFGASALAGFAIIASATNGFGVLLGLAVQVFPLFFSWSLMKMSGTFLEGINNKLSSMAARPLATNQVWADSRRQLSKQKFLAENPLGRPFLFLYTKKIARGVEMSQREELMKNRGLARYANKHYRRDGSLSRRGERDYHNQAENILYKEMVERDKNNFNVGVGGLISKGGFARNERQNKKLNKLDKLNMDRADNLKAELVRGEKIEYENAVGFHERMEDAINANMNRTHAMDKGYTKNLMSGGNSEEEARERYDRMEKIIGEGNVQEVGAAAAHSRAAHQKVYQAKWQSYFDRSVPTENIMLRLRELVGDKKDNIAKKNIDVIISGAEELIARGDSDKATEILMKTIESNNGNIEPGTHFSQSIAKFLQLGVGNKDPFMKKLAKHINVQTAAIYDQDGGRTKRTLDLDEYIRGYYEDDNGNKVYIKTGIEDLVKGTSMEDLERTALPNLDAMLKYVYKDDLDGLLRKRSNVLKAMLPEFLSSSMKHKSGGEALASMVDWLTGIKKKPVKDNGRVLLNEHGEAITEYTAAWEDDKFLKDIEINGPEDREKIRRHYMNNAVTYFNGANINQLYGQRSDFNDPFIYLFAMDYLDNKGIDDEDEANRAKCRTSYEELMAEKGFKNGMELLNDVDGLKFLKDMRSNDYVELGARRGVLKSIENLAKRSSAVGTTKDWTREAFNLVPGREDELRKSLIREQKLSKKKYGATKKSKPESDTESASDQSSFDDMRHACVGKINLLTDSGSRYKMGDSGKEYFEESRRILSEYFGNDHEVVMKYDNYYKENSEATVGRLVDKLKEILGLTD